jgi:hypothetical protein
MTQASSFQYKRGAIEIDTPWFPPDPEQLNRWRDELFELDECHDYTFWLCGAVQEDWLTSDVDVIVTGQPPSIQHLDKVLVHAIRLGFKHRQLIDIAWNDYYKKYLMKGRCNHRAICCEFFYDHGWCNVAECIKPAHDIETIVIGNEIIKNGEVITAPDPNAEKLTDSLYRIRMSSPSNKQIERIKEGLVYRSSPLIITPDLNFRTVVRWP